MLFLVLSLSSLVAVAVIAVVLFCLIINSNNLHAKRGFGFINNTLNGNIILEDKRVPIEI